MTPAPTKAFVIRRAAELRFAARITVAGMLSFVLAHALDLPQGYWAVFTAVLVVQASVGGSLKAAVDRLVGTLGGAVYGAIVATLIPHNDTFMLGIALAISLAPLTVLAAFSPSFRVAPITAVILLLGSAGAAEGPFFAALYRSIEVSLGGFVGIAVSVLVLPARAHALMGQIADNVAGQMAELLADLVDRLLGGEEKPLSARHDAIQAAFDKLEASAAEAHRERRTLLGQDVDPDPLPRTLRRIYHDLVLIGRIAAEPLPEDIRAQLNAPLREAAAAVARFLRETGAALGVRRKAPPAEACDLALARTLGAIEALPENSRAVALGFALEQMQRNLGDLKLRADEFAQMRAAKPV